MIRVYPLPPGKSGLSRLYIIYRTIQIAVKVKVFPKDWDQAKQKVKASFPDHQKANAQIAKKKAEVIKALEYFEVNDIEFTKQGFKAYLDSKGTTIIKPSGMYSVADLLRKYAKDKEKTLQKGYRRKYITIARNLDTYHPNLLASTFGMRQFNKLVDWLIDEKELENNTIHDYARKIRLVMQVYLTQGITVHPDHREFKYKYITPKPIWIDWDKVEILSQHEPMEDQVVYLQEFLFRCYTGLRWSDVHQLREEHIIRKDNDVYIDFTVIKTRLDQNLLLSSDAVAILKKWKWKVPKLYAHDCNSVIKQILRAVKHDGEYVFHDMIEKVRFSGSERKIKIMPEWKSITTHVARRSFARHWLDIGGALIMLSRLLGHRSTDQTLSYVGYHTKEVNDELRKLMG